MLNTRTLLTYVHNKFRIDLNDEHMTTIMIPKGGLLWLIMEWKSMIEFICPQCGETLKICGESQGESVSQEMKIDFLGNLPWDIRLNQLVDKGQVEEYYSAAMAAIVEKIIAKTEQ